MHHLIAVACLLTCLPAHSGARAGEIAFVPLQEGLELATLRVPPPEGDPDPLLHILRIDPKRFDLTLVAARARGEDGATVKTWAQRANLVAAINASMYQTDYRTSVSLMVGKGVVNNPRLSKDNTILAFDRIGGRGARARIIDRTCEPFKRLRTRYQSLVQSIRMLDCKGKNVWAKQDKRYSHAVIGQDRAGRILFIHTRAAWRSHDFVDALKGMPLDLVRLQYAEGGPPAQFYVKAGGVELHRFGSSNGGVIQQRLNRNLWPVPNVIGIIPRTR